jgi:hypothetical protein
MATAVGRNCKRTRCRFKRGIDEEAVLTPAVEALAPRPDRARYGRRDEIAYRSVRRAPYVTRLDP